MPSATPREAGRIVLAACAPSVATLVVAGLVWHAGPRDFTTLWNDETIYWNEAAVFRRAGFDGGYVTINEKPAVASFSRFGPHGPAFAVLYGSIGRMTGWQSYSPYLIHLLLIPLCAGCWLWVVRRHRQAWAAALLVAAFWPLLFYLPTSMQDPLHFGIALLFAALVESKLAAPWRVGLSVALMVLACVTRPTWALAIPALMWGRSPGTWRRILSVPLMAAVFVVSFVVVTRAAAPYPLTSWITAAVADPASGVIELLRAFGRGVAAFVVPYENWRVTLLRIELVAGVIVAALLWRGAGAHRWRLEFAALMMLPVLAAMFPAGDVASGREFHILAPHLLAALAVVAGADGRWASVPALVNLALLPTTLPGYVDEHDGRFAGTAAIRQFAEAVESRVAFDDNAASGWDNTVLMHADLLQPPLQGLPHGVAISFVLDWEDQPMPPRSRYLLLSERDEAQVRLRLPLLKIADTPLGTLYRNEQQATPH